KMPGDWWQQRATLRAYLAHMWAHPGKQLLFMGQEFAQTTEWSETHGPDWQLLDPDYSAATDHTGIRDLVRELNNLYRASPALWERDTDPSGFTWVRSDAADDNVFAFLRHAADGTPLLSVTNYSPVVRHDYALPLPEPLPASPAAWHEILNTDAAEYGGSGVTNPAPLKPDPALTLTLPPLATVWLAPR
ncbi:1,4-alpha-glucan branching enzyme, partial [Streptomyces sp. SID5785]|uniref:alpha amylase C-terminal domain-containing protein n=1 Tax=Streptomyces sp. SID5785 TaxID=2690309 RepID=UPI0013613165